jgi:predicted AAA+ superfamily ATPase
MFSRSLKAVAPKSFFLFGPRGTGKSTWVRTNLDPVVYLDLLEAATYTRLLASPGELETWIPPKHRGYVVIDEVQRVPELLNEVHRLIEKRRARFAMTGSSARKLRRGGVNLLAGRALTFHMHPLTATEQGADFDLAQSLVRGHLPAVFSEPEPARYLESYVQTYLREEVLQEGLTRNLAGFTRFLEAASFSHGAVLNVSAVARECAVERKVVEGWFGVLEDLLLASHLFPFTRRAKRDVVVHPKLYFFDAGVYRTLRPRGPLDRPEEVNAAALEGLVHQELRAVNDYGALGYALHYWRTPGGVEVDFVLYGERGLAAFEVKHAAKLRTDDFKGLRAFRKDYPMASCRLLYMGRDRRWVDDVEVIPVDQALRELPRLLEGS